MNVKKTIRKIIPRFILNGLRDYRVQKHLKDFEGDAVFCPICSSTFKIFESRGVTRRKNAKCPRCGSLERHRLQYKYLHEKTELFNPKTKVRLLHFAPEKFFIQLFSSKANIDYYPCDLSPELYKTKGKVKIHKVNITEIPFPDDHFDVILCNHVLEHIPDDKLAMSELYRVMKKGGWGIFQVPIDYRRETTYEDFSITTPAEREVAFGQNDHVRWYGKDYINRLSRAGFAVKEDDYIKSFSEAEQFRFGFISSELIYFCRK